MPSWALIPPDPRSEVVKAQDIDWGLNSQHNRIRPAARCPRFQRRLAPAPRPLQLQPWLPSRAPSSDGSVPRSLHWPMEGAACGGLQLPAAIAPSRQDSAQQRKGESGPAGGGAQALDPNGIEATTARQAGELHDPPRKQAWDLESSSAPPRGLHGLRDPWTPATWKTRPCQPSHQSSATGHGRDGLMLPDDDPTQPNPTVVAVSTEYLLRYVQEGATAARTCELRATASVTLATWR